METESKPHKWFESLRTRGPLEDLPFNCFPLALDHVQHGGPLKVLVPGNQGFAMQPGFWLLASFSAAGDAW